MNIELRPIRYDDNQDKENYFALQKSVAILQKIYSDYKEYDEWFWKEFAKNKNRVCFVIEELPEYSYCGGCAIKNISDDIPEIEIELMKEQQNKGIGYQALVILLNRLAEEYGKTRFYARVEPDNYVSQLLFEKLGGIPAGISRDYQISDERAEQFMKMHEDLLDEKIQEIAEKFKVETKLLLTHVLVYLIDVQNISSENRRTEDFSDSRESIVCPRRITREKHVDVLKEMLEDLQHLMDLGEENQKSVLLKKLDEMEKRILDKMERLEIKNYFLEN